MMDNRRSIWEHYKKGWHLLLSNWKVILIVYGMNLLLAFVAMGPLSNALKKAFESSTLQEQFVSSFDYTLIMDFLHEYGTSVELSTAVMGYFAILYLLWSIFYTGGYLAVIRQRVHHNNSLNFWSGGAYYFFRFLRLTIYVLGIIGFVLFILSKIFSSGGTSPFVLDGEETLIAKGKFLLVIFLVVLFVIGIFKDFAKIKIAQADKFSIAQANMSATNRVFKLNTILLAFLNIVFLIFGLLLYLLLKKIMGGYLIPSLIIGQLFLLYRMAYKFVRLASFGSQEEVVA